MKGRRRNKNLELKIQTPKREQREEGELGSQATEDITQIIKEENKIKEVKEVERTVKIGSNTWTSPNKRKEIKVSLVEGMLYDGDGENRGDSSLENSKFLELNFRKQSGGYLQLPDRKVHEARKVFRGSNYSKQEIKNDENQEYVQKFLENAAGLSFLNNSIIDDENKNNINQNLKGNLGSK